MNKRNLGGHYEELAAEFLRMQGYEILECNYRNRFGEIDLIARYREGSEKSKSTLIFVEVKYRRTKKYGLAYEAVDKKKQRTIVKVAWYYLKVHGYQSNQSIRFDIITIQNNEIHQYENAFWGYDL